MQPIDIVNGIVFQKLNSEDNLRVYQKKIYLLQAMGSELGFSFQQDVRGPWSPDLSDYYYEKHDVFLAADFSDYHLSETAAGNIQMVNNLLSYKPQEKEYDYKKMIENGYRNGIVRLTDGPFDSGVVCFISDYWFYFGGAVEKEKSLSEYVETVPEDVILKNIFETLEDFRGRVEFTDEYEYYTCILKEDETA